MTALTDGHIFVGDNTNTAQDVAMSGAVAIDDTGKTTTTATFGITIDGAGAVPGTGSQGFVTIPYNCTIVNWYMAANVAGSAVIDIKRLGSSIVGGGNKPTLTSQSTNHTAASGWTSLSIAANDVIEFNLDSASTLARVNLVLSVTRTSL